MAVLKDTGWTIACNPVSGKITIYRRGTPGEITVQCINNIYKVSIDNDKNESIKTVHANHMELT